MSTEAPCALISVSDKQKVARFAEGLADRGYRILSTGGTADQLREAGVEVDPVSEVTGFPEIFDGRVKTLHPLIHGGVLAREDCDADRETRLDHGIPRIDLVCVNLYDFAGALQRGLNDRDLVEEIDIGGPTLLRAAAKNYHSLAVLPDPSFYSRFQAELRSREGSIGLSLRKELAAYTFSMVSRYDRLISEGLGGTEERSSQ